MYPRNQYHLYYARTHCIFKAEKCKPFVLPNYDMIYAKECLSWNKCERYEGYFSQ
jgi:hypothetical protein